MGIPSVRRWLPVAVSLLVACAVLVAGSGSERGESTSFIEAPAAAAAAPAPVQVDPFVALLATCGAASAPWSTRGCLAPAWKLAGCSRRGRRYPGSQASTVLWNQMPTFQDVINDMKAIAKADTTDGTAQGQCKGKREVFFYASGPKRYIWNGAAGVGYPYNTKVAAQAACASLGATLATEAQLQEAWRDGAEWCLCGAVADSDKWSFPMHHALDGCGNKVGVLRTCSAGGATCFGVKPDQKRAKAAGISPFKPGQWHQDKWTPLVKTCAHEPPYSLDQCILPAWKLAGCTSLGRDYPAAPGSPHGAKLLASYNTMSWDSVREDMIARSRNEPASCLSKFAILDDACNHPPPYSTKRCLRKALKLAGCDATGFLWPTQGNKKGEVANVWWNRQKWPVVVADMQKWAQADLVDKKATHIGGCRGLKEAFWYSGGPPASYQFSNAKEAAKACATIGAVLATPEQVAEAYKAGAEWCAAGFTTDGQARYPIQTPRSGCATVAGVAVWASATKGGATCYGFKPNPAEVTGLLPFHPKTRFSQVREWRVSPTTECSRSCGGGEQTREVKCVEAMSGEVRPSHTCASLGPKPKSTGACNIAPCAFDWMKSDWSDCSVSCGGGKQERTMRCVQSASGNEFPVSKCLAAHADQTAPRTSRKCNTQACVSFAWKIAPWTTCTKECTADKQQGGQKRTVVCLGSDSKVHPDSRCMLDGSEKPSIKQACNTHACPTYSWIKGDWTACSLSCNGGVTTRTAQCVGSDGALADKASSRCMERQPLTSKPCNTGKCMLYTWRRAPWTNCSRTCGGGQQTRAVTCADTNNKTAALAACVVQGPQPLTSKGCNTVPCRDFNWFAHKWNDCTSSCGGGTQTRKVACVAANGDLAADAQCGNAGAKKDTKQACNTKPCVTLMWERTNKETQSQSLLELGGDADPAATVKEGWTPCTETCGGGVQTRSFVCKASDGTKRDAAACEVVLGASPLVKQTCNTKPCISYDFVPGAWGDCSLSCGGGLTNRDVPCMGSDGIEVPKSTCTKTGLIQQPRQKTCNTRPCEGFTWIVSPYSRCDASCGGGLQTRKVTCQGSSGKKYDDRHCAQVGYDKPESARPCNTHRCVEMQWRIGSWDSCDRSCGGGDTHRSVACFGTDGKSYSDQDCLDSYMARNASLTILANKKPEIQRTCNSRACASFFWEVADWDACSTRCGGGLQTRPVVCRSTTGTDQPDALCTALASKPRASQQCNTHTCSSYKLDLTKWDDCSASCGGGLQTRVATCSSSAGVRITDPLRIAELCPAAPDLEQQCNTQACTTSEERGWIIKPWSQCSLACGGGVQQRLVKCQSSADKTCSSFGERPVSERACNIQQCTIYEWQTGDWAACSRSCGADGVQRRELSCKGSDGSFHNDLALCASAGKQPSRTKACRQSPCISYFWKASEWATCSKSCDGGTTTREVACMGSDGARRTDDACATQGAKPANTKACNTAACEKHEFKVGEWESCSVGCGTGLQTRSVQCRSTTTLKLVNLNLCATGDAPVPKAERECNTVPCITYYWQLGQFGSCSNKCNGGFMERAVTCMGSDGARYKDDFCLTYSYKAPTQAICNTKPCGTFAWQPEPVWSSCSVSCDKGVQTRPIRCVGADGNNWPHSVCKNTTLALGKKPEEPAQLCNTHSCMTTMWDVTAWSNCTRHCGGGKQIRVVTCRKADGTRIPDRVCARLTPKPRETQTCNSEACPTYTWVADEFGDCSVSCGGGVAVRDVKCANNFGSKVSSRHCYRLGLERPQPSEACNLHACGTASSWAIDPWQPCSRGCGGGIRMRSVECRVSKSSTDTKCQSILPMPVVSEQCNSHPCLTYKYEASPWTVCSKSCDDEASMKIRNSTASSASQSRQLRCLASDGSYSSLKQCAKYLQTAETPATQRLCTTNALCKKYKWVFGPWAKCTDTCGRDGSQHRQVTCTDDAGLKVHKSLCVFSGPKPYSARRCNSHKCVRAYKWRADPWKECSQVCGDEPGEQHRGVTCVDRYGTAVTSQACELLLGPQPKLKRECNHRACMSFKWAAKPWGTCSAWCGGGVEERSITCVARNGRVQKDLYCTMTNGEKAETHRACNTKPCVTGKWKKATKWGECSRSCGGGQRERPVVCVGTDGYVLPDQACAADGPRPRSTSACNAHKCVSTSWFIGSWSKCSLKCGGGVQRREVACVASDGVVKADVNCAYAGDKAPLEQPCNTYACDAYKRQYTPWSDCTSSCGGGKQSRTQTCFNTATEKRARTAAKCDHIKIEDLERKCNTDKCLTYQWALGAWEKCSKDCGGGEKARTVVCTASNGAVAKDGACLLLTAKPDTKRSCHSTPCNSDALYGWKVAEWGSCSAKCGSGQQTRTVECSRKSSGLVVEASNCVTKRPPLSRTCNTPLCVAFNWNTTGEWSACSKPCGGGQKRRRVICQDQLGGAVPKSKCADVGGRPERTAECNTQRCPTKGSFGGFINPEDMSRKDKARKAKLDLNSGTTKTGRGASSTKTGQGASANSGGRKSGGRKSGGRSRRSNGSSSGHSNNNNSDLGDLDDLDAQGGNGSSRRRGSRRSHRSSHGGDNGNNGDSSSSSSSSSSRDGGSRRGSRNGSSSENGNASQQQASSSSQTGGDSSSSRNGSRRRRSQKGGRSGSGSASDSDDKQRSDAPDSDDDDDDDSPPIPRPGEGPSEFTSSEVIHWLPVVPQFHDKVVDEYEA